MDGILDDECESQARTAEAGVKLFLLGTAEAALTILILLKFGWIGVLIALPILAGLMLVGHWAQERWKRRGSLR